MLKIPKRNRMKSDEAFRFSRVVFDSSTKPLTFPILRHLTKTLNTVSKALKPLKKLQFLDLKKKLKYEKLANRCRGNGSSLRFLVPNHVLQLGNGLFLEKEDFISFSLTGEALIEVEA